jgi:2-methylcitrate dehydratase PrpD
LQPARIQALDAQALLARVEVRPDERFTAHYPGELSARITIYAKDHLMDLLSQIRPAAAFPATHPGIQ